MATLVLVVQMIVTFLLEALVVFGVARVLPGVRIASYGSAVAVAVVYSGLSMLLSWLLVLLSFPVIIVTLGAFLLVINGFLLWLTDKILDGFEIRGFVPLSIATVCITVGEVLVRNFVERLF